MKKTLVLLFAALLVVAFTVPASAFDSEFGGLWRTRWYVQGNFTGNEDVEGIPGSTVTFEVNPDTGVIEPTTGVGIAKSVNVIDTRTRLYYTAIFSDNFRFVNRFEFNVTWGGSPGGGIGTDGTGIFRIKNSYADMRLGTTRWTVGLQGAVLARGFLFDDDFAGLIARYQPGTTGDMLVPFIWAKVKEGQITKVTPATTAIGANDDTNLFGLYPFFPMGNMTFNPYVFYLHNNLGEDNDQYWLGIDFDAKFDAWSLFLSGIYQSGDLSSAADISAYLLAGGFNVPFGGFGLHGEAFYATGEKDGLTDGTQDAFTGIPGQSYYWAEIMGLGIFDNNASFGAPGNKISDILAVNLGVDFTPSDMWKIKADLWYANLAEDDVNGNADLGTELDIVLTYKLIENMNLDLVGAYLFAGDATNANIATSGSDPYEVGLRLQFTF